MNPKRVDQLRLGEAVLRTLVALYWHMGSEEVQTAHSRCLEYPELGVVRRT